MRLSLKIGIWSSVQILLAFLMQLIVIDSIGPGADTDALFASMNISFIAQGLAVTIQNGVLIPYLAEYSENWASSYALRMARDFFIVLTAAAVLMYGLAPFLTQLLVPGFTLVQKELTTTLTRVQLAAIPAYGLLAVTSAYCITVGRVVEVSFANAFSYVVSAGMLWIGISSGGTMLAAFGQVVIPGVAASYLYISQLFFRESSPLEQEQVSPCYRLLGTAAVPLLLGALYSKSGFLVDRMLMSFLSSGSLTAYDFSLRLQSAFVRVGGQGGVTPLQTPLAQAAHGKDWERFQRLYVNRARILLASFSSMTLLCLLLTLNWDLWSRFLPPRMFGFSGDEFKTILQLSNAMFGVVVTGPVIHLLSISLFALKDTKTQTKITTTVYTVGLFCKLTGFYFGGITGMAFALTVEYFLTCGALYWSLGRKIDKCTVSDRRID